MPDVCTESKENLELMRDFIKEQSRGDEETGMKKTTVKMISPVSMKLRFASQWALYRITKDKIVSTVSIYKERAKSLTVQNKVIMERLYEDLMPC